MESEDADTNGGREIVAWYLDPVHERDWGAFWKRRCRSREATEETLLGIQKIEYTQYIDDE